MSKKKNRVIKVDDEELVYDSSDNGIFLAHKVKDHDEEIRLDTMEYCRELFFEEFLDFNDSFFFKLPQQQEKKTESAIKFIEWFQDICKLKKGRAKILKTTSDKIIAIKLGKFWSNNWMRKDLFTALLRAAFCHGRNFTARIKNCDYLYSKDSPSLHKALEMFIAGKRNFNKVKIVDDYYERTYYDEFTHDSYGGWRDTFCEPENLYLLKK